MENSQEFMLLFRFEPSNEQPTQEQLQEMEKQWGQFIGNIAMQGKLLTTHQLGFEGKIIASNHTTEDGFYVAQNQMLSGTMVLKANSLEVATELAKNCPILYMGGTVEVRNILPMN
jgi:hypothetical protein